MLTFLLWVLVGYIILGIVGQIFTVNRPRPTLTPGWAAVNVITSVAIITLLVLTILAL